METNQWEAVLLDIVKSTKEGVVKGVDIAMQEAPEICHQLLVFKMWEHGIYAIVLMLPLLSFFAALFVLRKHLRMIYDFNEAHCVVSCAGSLCWVVFGCFLFGAATTHALNLIKLIVAPKVYLIEYLSTLIK